MRLHFNKTAASFLALALAPSLAGAGAPRARFVMGTLCEIDAPGAPDAAVTAAFEELQKWDRVLSGFIPASEAVRVNREAARAPVQVSADYWEAVTLTLEMSRRSDGAFDATLQPRGWEAVRLDPAARTVAFARPGLALDFGGIGKGLALDRAAAVLRRAGVRRALFNFGGQLYALGEWHVLVGGRGFLIKDASLSTSGGSEQPGHIKDPATGRPVSGRDVTVLAPTGAEADAWSTAIYVTHGRPPAAFRACAGCRLIQGGAS